MEGNRWGVRQWGGRGRRGRKKGKKGGRKRERERERERNNYSARKRKRERKEGKKKRKEEGKKEGKEKEKESTSWPSLAQWSSGLRSCTHSIWEGKLFWHHHRHHSPGTWGPQHTPQIIGAWLAPGADPGINYEGRVGVHKSVNIIMKGEGGAHHYSTM